MSTILANCRFDLPLRAADFAAHSIALPVPITDGRAVSPGTIAATPTHDGYYVARGVIKLRATAPAGAQSSYNF
ncbi:hypothetical protein [Sphingomonas sp. S2-65]|uniref:hypothetical protein n=1 Tax=Sphingomonas sp. S2-65 TaxID=2903960 RepID=UPI001F271C1F|nr:hypothetical protein [Sphingomonas sp. S2-65]UYY59656.1 hypothetical protein LZ586_06115 [Sphingomonas sp. S2-65]